MLEQRPFTVATVPSLCISLAIIDNPFDASSVSSILILDGVSQEALLCSPEVEERLALPCITGGSGTTTFCNFFSFLEKLPIG
jgi:hypothetical protein